MVVDHHRRTALKNAVIDPRVRQIRMIHFIYRQIRRDDQRLVAAVASVDHAEHLFQRKFGIALDTEIVDDQQIVLIEIVNKCIAVTAEHRRQCVQYL